MPDEMRRPNGPAGDPWWRFTPRNRATGYLSLFAAACCLVASGSSLLPGGLGMVGTVSFAVLAAMSVLWLLRSATGLKALLRDQALRSSGGREPVWPAADPWWRFTPRNRATGALGLFSALYALTWSAWSLLAGGLGTRRTVFFALLTAVGVLWLVSAATGLVALLRDRARR